MLCSGQPGVGGIALPQPATWETAFTSMFLHANLLHIGGNMVFLAVFGATLEDTIGRLRFLAFYFLALPGILAKTILKKFYEELDLARYSVLVMLFLTMFTLPLKMVLRWTMTLKYFVDTPWIKF